MKFQITGLLCVLGLITAAFSHAQQNQSVATTKPNVLFLICDDLNCDMGLYGHPLVKTPNIDKLAKRGVRFDNAHCQFALCGPSRASFMSGLYPDQTLIHKNAVYLRQTLPKVKTVTQLFRDNGYFATRIGKIYHYNVPKHIGTAGHDDPYSWNYTINPRGKDVTVEPIVKTLQPNKFGGTLSWLATESTDEEQTDGISATRAIEELNKSADDGVPFFLAVGLFRPHTPFVAPKKYFDLYDRAKITVPTIPEGYDQTIPAAALQTIRRKKHQVALSDLVSREIIEAYYASISFADAQVGRILDALDTNGLAENTVVIFASDHGFHMGEHDHWQKSTLFENGTRIPLIIAGPGITATGQASSSPVEMVDFYPTLAELAGLTPPNHLAGTSLLPILKDSTASVRKFALSQFDNGYSIKGLRYRYTEWGKKGSLGKELYDHDSDPKELHNLASNPEFAKLAKHLADNLHSKIAANKRVPKGLMRTPLSKVVHSPTSSKFAPK